MYINIRNIIIKYKKHLKKHEGELRIFVDETTFIDHEVTALQKQCEM